MSTPDPRGTAQALLDKDAIAKTIARLAEDIIEEQGVHPLAFVGIHTRGIPLAQRVLKLVEEKGLKPDYGTVDIALYRDDLHELASMPIVKGSKTPFTVEGAHIILFDDVLYTGRTIRSALEEIIAFGRPAKIELAVLVDRGHRELPVAADYIGETVETQRDDYIEVCFEETDSKDSVTHFQKER